MNSKAQGNETSTLSERRPEQKDTAQEFTPAQIADWQRYEKVRKGGHYNMFDPRARAATGLSAERYSFVLTHYSALKSRAAT